MYRRIELINHYPQKDGSVKSFLQGLCGVSTEEVATAWTEINEPRKRVNKRKGKFYFTEAGWDRFGRETIAACIRSGQEYRVIAVEEHDVDVCYKDEYQVVVLPKRKRE